jgi:acetyl-CoA carboxylase biotin carboxylase subunit
MFDKVLVANRGEIAVRIIRACKEMGIQTVAVYSEIDRQALHVRYADEAYLLGAAPARESYLCGDRVIEIARKCGASAIHPGYGFLAERADFAHDCLDAGLAFIGPKPSSIAAMGDKAVARATVSRAGVQVVPGTEGEGSLSDEDLLAVAPKIGFPLLVKATAGGGGKGMREVQNLDEMPSLLHAARREAEASFGDGNVYLEKLVEGARHIEFQILADTCGNVIHLGERECSLQRRHQKLLEESPSPFIDQDEALRQQMGEVAVRAAQAVGYINAGTIEFLVDQEKHFYFLEMNTRLQVEHPVTEMVSGVDIVKEQIRIARGESLRYRGEDIIRKGWAIECRINAEDPYNHFLPSTGKITQIIMPAGPGLRVDSGVYPGFEISPYYDSLISKLVVWGETRVEAVLRMHRALEEYQITGIRTNIPFHQKIINTTPFRMGQFDTRFVEERFSMDETGNGKDPLTGIAAIFATLVAHKNAQHATHITQRNKNRSSNWKRFGQGEGLG